VAGALSDLGIDSIEDVKMLKPEEWSALFAEEMLVKRRKAEQAYSDLCREMAVVTATAVPIVESQCQPAPSAPVAEMIQERAYSAKTEASNPASRQTPTTTPTATARARGNQSRRSRFCEEVLCCWLRCLGE